MKDADCDISWGRIKFSQDYLSSFTSVVGQRETVTAWDGIASHSSTQLCRLVSGWSRNALKAWNRRRGMTMVSLSTGHRRCHE